MKSDEFTDEKIKLSFYTASPLVDFTSRKEIWNYIATGFSSSFTFGDENDEKLSTERKRRNPFEMR